jgi:uncharacterized protein YkwD
MTTSNLRAGATLALLALLAACGGGGDPAPATAGTPTGSPAPSPTPAPPPAPAPSPPPSGVLSTCNLPDFAAALLARINQARAAGANCGSSGNFAPIAALAWHALLTQAADGHSQDMAAANYFSHTSADGRTLSDRVGATGYAWRSIGENIAAGYGSVDAVMDGWLASPGHCANIMSPNFADVGVACVPGTSGARYPTYWTMNLASPR